jgi:short-subunit dehydrogenase
MSVALVTGASSGIGLEIARILGRKHDIVLAARGVDALNALAGELPNAPVVAVDLADDEGAQLVAEVPDVDILVNNAGFGDWAPFADADEQKLDDMIELNIRALTRLTRAYLPAMLARGSGRVLNVAATVAAYGVKAMERGKVVATPGFSNKVFAISVRFSPRGAVRRIVHWMQAPKK